MTVNESQIRATLLESLDLDQQESSTRISGQERGIVIAIAHKVVVHPGFRLDPHQLIKLILLKPWGW